MKRRFTLLISFFLTILAGCKTVDDATSAQAVNGLISSPTLSEDSPWHTMLGKWYGNQPDLDGGRHEWLNELHPDGSYTTYFKRTGRTEIGLWGLSGDIYFKIKLGELVGDIFIPDPDGGQSPRYAYKMIKLGNEEMIYQSLVDDLNDIFIARRVGDDFSL